MCLYPKLIENKKYKANKKNGGNIPTVKDRRTLMVPIGCGNCIECRKMKAREWQVRLNEELRNGKKAEFITLTFSNEEYSKLYNELWFEDWGGVEGYRLDNNIAKLAVRRFLERWRHFNKKSLKHWLITELGSGETEHIHLHGIVWTDKKEEIEKTWKYGYVFIGEWVNEQTINYITKYVLKADEIHKEYKPKILASPGIGSGYMKRIDAENNKYKSGETKEYYKTRKGIKLSLPIYMRNHIYSEEEREKLWIEKLDKQERWVLGQKIDISNGIEEYQRVLKEAQNKNKRLGYRDGKKDWEQEEYENKQRTLIQQKRLGNKK